MKKIQYLSFFFFLLLLSSSCEKEGRSILFGKQKQIELGQQTRDQILENPEEYGAVLNRADNAKAYKYLDEMVNTILESGEMNHKDDFEWEVRIIHKKDVLNAFATPGGYIFVYADLIKYLDKADNLAGVLGHEIAHSDREHSARNLEKVYGLQILVDIALGEGKSKLTEIATGMALGSSKLKFSRKTETEADAYSVKYLKTTPYSCNGAAGFFEKIKKDNGCSKKGTTWASTHPDPCDRIEAINSDASKNGCGKGGISESGYTYSDFQSDMPK